MAAGTDERTQDAREMAKDQDEAPEGATDEAGPKGGRKKPLVIGAGLMALCGAGAFAAVSMGFVPGLGGAGAEAAEAAGDHAEAAAEGHGGDYAAAEDHGGGGGHGEAAAGAAGVAFVPIEPMTVTLGSGPDRAHLRFTSQLEVPASQAPTVQAMMPRIVDVLGGYLRALEPAMVEERDAQVRLRAQMLRRVRLVVGADAVRDLLVMEFVIN